MTTILPITADPLLQVSVILVYVEHRFWWLGTVARTRG